MNFINRPAMFKLQTIIISGQFRCCYTISQTIVQWLIILKPCDVAGLIFQLYFKCGIATSWNTSTVFFCNYSVKICEIRYSVGLLWMRCYSSKRQFDFVVYFCDDQKIKSSVVQQVCVKYGLQTMLHLSRSFRFFENGLNCWLRFKVI